MKLGVVVATVLSLLVTAQAGAAVGHRVSEREADSARGFWTAGRIAKALENDLEFGRRPAPDSGSPRVHHRPVLSSRPEVGKLVGWSPQGEYSCTGTLIDTPSLSLVLTAAHCIYYEGEWATRLAFFPEFKYGSSPHGGYKAKTTWITTPWYRQSFGVASTHYDMGVVAMQKTLMGSRIGDHVDAMPVKTFPRRRGATDLYGYPGGAMGAQVMRTCRAQTRAWAPWFLPGPAGRIARCNMARGSSGGPWISRYRDEEGNITEAVDGLTSTGFSQGRRSYLTSPYFGWHLKDLIESAERTLTGRRR